MQIRSAIAIVVTTLCAAPVAMPRQSTPGRAGARSDAGGATDLVASIAGRALVPNGAMEFLRTLVDSVGPRVTGTQQSRAAAELLRDTLRHAGFASAHFEEYEFHPRWQRGPIDVRVLRPVDRVLTVGSYGWVPGTRGRVDARLVDLGRPRGRDVPPGTEIGESTTAGIFTCSHNSQPIIWQKDEQK